MPGVYSTLAIVPTRRTAVAVIKSVARLSPGHPGHAAQKLRTKKKREKPGDLVHVIVTQGSEDLLQLVHGDLVDLRVELALPDLLATDAPVVLGHGSSRLGGHLRT